MVLVFPGGGLLSVGVLLVLGESSEVLYGMS